jgi:hypothetical protein
LAVLPVARRFPIISPSPYEVTTQIRCLSKKCRSLCFIIKMA